MKYILLLLFFFISLSVFSQPVNNTIDTAIPINIPIGSTCDQGFNFTLAWNTDGTTGNYPTSCYYNAYDQDYSETDQFFTWTATALTLRKKGVYMTIYDENYNEILCSTINNIEYVELDGWEIGDNLIIQIWKTDPPGTNGDVSFCLLQYLPPPNNEVTGAIPIIIPNVTTACQTPLVNLPISSDGTSYSGLATSCNVGGYEYEGPDQFFSWTATSSILVWNLFPGSSQTFSNPTITIRNNTTYEIIDCTPTTDGNYSDTVEYFAELSGWNIGDDLIIQIANTNYTYMDAYGIDQYVVQTADINFCLQQTNTFAIQNGLLVNNITQNTVNVELDSNLVANNWNIEYGEAGFIIGTGIIINNVASPHTITGLTESTNYDIYVQQIGSDGTLSAWTKINFNTSIAPITEDYTFDFTELSTEGGWYRANEGTSNNYPIGGNTSDWIIEPFVNDYNHVNGNAASIRSRKTEDWLISPRISLGEDSSYNISLETAVTKWYNSDPDLMESQDEIELLITLDNGINWINLHTWDITNSPSSQGESFSLDIPSSFNNNIVRFAFWANIPTPTNFYTTYDFFIDNFEVKSTTLSVIDYEQLLFSIHPNPATYFINIDSKIPLISSTIRDINGRYIKKIKHNNNDFNIKIDVKDFMEGVYFLEIESQKGKYVKRFIKN